MEQPHGRYLLVKYGLILARSKSAFPEACPCLIALTGITAAKHTPQGFLPDFPRDLAPTRDEKGAIAIPCGAAPRQASVAWPYPWRPRDKALAAVPKPPFMSR